MVILLTLLSLGFGLLMGWWLWSPTKSYKALQGENQDLRGQIEILQGELQKAHTELQETRTLKAREWARDGAKHLDVQDPRDAVKSIVARDESYIIAKYGAGSEVHQVFRDRNGAPGDERIPLGIQNIVTGTVDDLAGGLVDHGPNGGRVEYLHFAGTHIGVEDQEQSITPDMVLKVAEDIAVTHPELVK